MMYIPFNPNHLLGLDLVEEEKFLQEAFSNGELRRHWMTGNLNFSAIDEGKLYSCFGAFPLAPCRALIWVLFDKTIGPRRFVSVAKKAEEIITSVLPSHFYRLEAYVQADYEKASKFAELCKFKREGLMKKFDGERDFFLYARIE